MFGVSTFCLHDQPLSMALDRISAVTDHIEIMDDGLHFLKDADLLENYSASFTFHSPHRGTNIASLLEPIRKASVEVMADCFAVASSVNAGVVIHPGYFAWAEERQRAERQLRTSLTELTKIADDLSVTFFVENMGNWNYFLLKTPDELPLIGDTPFALDVGHAHQNGCLSEFLCHPIGHFHLHDNNGKEDSHDAVGDFGIDFSPIMDAVRSSGVVPVIEVTTFEGVLKSIDRLRSL